MITYLAVGFILALLGLILYGFGIVLRRPNSETSPDGLKCTICRRPFDKNALVERQIGDSKILYFCTSCIRGLARDLPA